jgi:hypothetical protein
LGDSRFLMSSSVRALEEAAVLRRRRAFGAAALLALLVAFDACVVEPRWLLVPDDVSLPSARSSTSPGSPRRLRVAVVSDLHTTGYGLVERSVVAALQKGAPDVIAITGDVVDEGRLEAARPVLDALAKLAPRLGIWVVGGNWEQWRPPREDVHAFYASLGIHTLEDRHEPLGGPEDGGYFIVGVDWEGSARTAFRGIPRGAPVLALVHGPGVFPELSALARAGDHRLVVAAGHTHGGQVRLPFFGALWLPPGSGAYVDGAYGDTTASLYVSRGVGTSLLPIRFFCRPELPTLVLR